VRRDRSAGLLLLVAGLAFLVLALGDRPPSVLRLVAAGALITAGLLRLLRARRA
jgi:hypothetical protein